VGGWGENEHKVKMIEVLFMRHIFNRL